MNSQENLQAIKADLLKLEKLAGRLCEAAGGLLLSEEETQAAILLLQETAVAQKTHLEELQKEIGFAQGPEITLSALETLVEEKKRRQEECALCARCREIFLRFGTLVSPNQECQTLLTGHQNRLAAYTDPQLARLDYDKDVAPYQAIFDAVVKKADIEEQRKIAADQASFFGTDLMLHFLMGNIKVRAEEKASFPPVVSDSKSLGEERPILPRQREGGEEMPGKAAPEQGPLPAEEKEAKTGETAPEPALLAQLPKKRPNSSSSLLRDIKHKRRGFMRTAAYFSKMILTQGPMPKELLLRLVPEAEGGAANQLQEVADYFIREGYLCQYALDTAPEQILYDLTAAGRATLLKESCQKELFAKRLKACEPAKITSTDQFRQYYWALRACAEILVDPAVKELENGENFYYEVQKFAQVPALTGRRDQKAERLAFVLLPVFMLRQGGQEELTELWQQVKARLEGSGILVLLSDQQEEAAQWCVLARRNTGLRTMEAVIQENGGLTGPEGQTIGVPRLFGKEEGAPDPVPQAQAEQEKAAEGLAQRESPEPAPPLRAEHALEKALQQEPDREALSAPVQFTKQPAGQIARQMLEHGDERKDENFVWLMLQLLNEDRVVEAAALLQVLAAAPNAAKGLQTLYRTLVYGANLPFEPHEYSAAAMNRLQSESDEQAAPLRQTAFVSAMIWALCFPDTEYDHALYSQARAAVSESLKAVIPAGFQPLKQLFSLLTQDLFELSCKVDGLGFSGTLRSYLASDDQKKQTCRQLCASAGAYLQAPRSTIGITGLETFLKNIMGPASKIGGFVHQVQRDDRSAVKEMNRFLEPFLTKGRRELSKKALEKYIDDEWAHITEQDRAVRVKKLKADSPARNGALRELTSRMQLLLDWLSLVDSSVAGMDEKVLGALGQLMNRTANLMEQICGELEEYFAGQSENVQVGAGLHLLRDTLKRVHAVLKEGAPASPAWAFLPLYRSPYLMLGENGGPMLISELYHVENLEPWRMMLRHLAADGVEPEEAVRRIAGKGESDSDWYENYGAAEYLNRYLHASRGVPEESYTHLYAVAEESAGNEETAFKSEIRLNRAYGTIQEHTAETAFAAIEAVRPYYLGRHNYAGFHTFLAALSETVQGEITRQQKRYQEELRLRCQDPQKANAPIIKYIKRALEEKKFAQAEEYINRLDAGEEDLPTEQVRIDLGENFHETFLHSANAYYRECVRREHKQQAPNRWAVKVLDGLPNRWSSQNEKAKAAKLLDSWITSKGSPKTPGQIKGFLAGIGFEVLQAELNQNVRQGDQYECYRVQMERVRPGLKDYAHPIAKFGTGLPEAINVVCLYGCKGASTLISIITQKLQLSGPTIVLMDGSLSLEERKKIAANFKGITSLQNSFLLIDRVLLLYLASLDEGERMCAMLHCTLPYTFEQPFTNGSGPVADEMFIGRIPERNDLCSLDGACLIYGGRQLGKTALLQRAANIKNQPAEKIYSVYIDIKEQRSEFLLEQLNKNLQKLGLLLREAESLKELCDRLQDAYQEHRLQQLFIFVDEVDAFFEEIKKDNYNALHPVVVLHKSTEKHVKFVFAGTHNVADYDGGQEQNSDILQLGRALCISPLSPADARKLIMWPLSYLGFRIGEKQVALILSNTNSYPGLIHLFCKALVESVCKEYAQYYAGGKEDENPPYQVSDEQMKAVFKEQDIRQEIGKRVMATICLNSKYRIVSYLIAYLTYQGREQGDVGLFGYTPTEIQACGSREFGLGAMECMNSQNLFALLKEMEKMGILWKQPDGERFRFLQQDFLDYIGSQESVEEYLLDAEGKVQA